MSIWYNIDMLIRKNKTYYCSVHQSEHEPKTIDHFRKECKRWGIKVKGNECPIYAFMEREAKSGLSAVDNKCSVHTKDCTKNDWPPSIDLMLTKLPSSEEEGYSKGLMGFVANRCFSNMNQSGLVYAVVSSYKEDKNRPWEIAKTFQDAGFSFVDTIIWFKSKFTPTQGSKRLNNIYDYVFMFSKGDGYHLNREGIAYLKDRMGDGEKVEEHLCPGNLWKVKVDEKDQISYELAKVVTTLANVIPKSLVVDPFMGSDSVLRISLENSYNFWGCEPDRAKLNKHTKLIKKFKKGS